MARVNRILQRVAVQGHSNHVAAGRFHGFLDRQRYFARFTATETYATVAITHGGQRSEGENPASFHYLGDTVYLDQFLLQTFFVLSRLVFQCHSLKPLEFQAAFTSSIGQRLDTTVIVITGAIKRYFADAGLL